MLALAASVAGGAVVGGCAVTEADLERWETTLGGPKRLSAVVLHDKYPHDLRVEAAVSLIEMKPRKGRHVGIERLVKGTLVCDPEWLRDDEDEDEPCQKRELGPEERAAIMADLVPIIIERLGEEPPPPAQKGKSAPDPSFQFKDAAYLMLSYEKEQIVADPELRDQLEQALIDWAMADFERRLNDRSQAYGMEQLLSYIGPASVARLPSQMEKSSRNLEKMADIIARIGAKETKERAGERLVEIAKYTASDKWREDYAPKLEEANRRGKFEPSEEQFAKQMNNFQRETLVRIYGSMKKVGGDAVRKYALSVAADGETDKKLRQVALAALEGHIDKDDDDSIDTLFEIAASDAPGVVIDQAFGRLIELPRERVAEQLYEFFDTDEWKLRRLAAATLLQMSKVSHVDDFFEALDENAENFNLPEAITYGAHLGDLEGGDPLEALRPHMESGEAPSRLSALAYWYEHGNAEDVETIEAYADDELSVPECDEDAGCSWQCSIEEGETDEGEPKKVSKDIETVGDFVTYCVLPQARENEPQEGEEGSEGEKNGGEGDK